MTTQQKQFENTAELYRIELCKMFNVRYSDTDWIANNVGGVLDVQCGRLTLSFDDVRYIVDNHMTLAEVDEWQDYNNAVNYIKGYLNNINLQSWHKGCPHIDATKWDAELMRVQMGS